MTPAEIKTAIESQFPGSVLENEDLAENQVELKGEQWLEMATFMKNDPNLSFDQLECITGIDTGEAGPLQTRYNFHSMEHRHKIEVVISHDRENPRLLLSNSFGASGIGSNVKPMTCSVLCTKATVICAEFYVQMIGKAGL